MATAEPWQRQHQSKVSVDNQPAQNQSICVSCPCHHLARPSGLFPKTNRVCSPLQPLLLCLVKHRQDCAQTDDNKFSTSSYQCVQSKQRGYSRIKTKAKPCRNSSESTLERMTKNTEGQKQTKHECKRHTTKSVAWLPQTKTSVHGRQPDGQAKTGEPIGQAALLRLVATTHVIL